MSSFDSIILLLVKSVDIHNCTIQYAQQRYICKMKMGNIFYLIYYELSHVYPGGKNWHS